MQLFQIHILAKKVTIDSKPPEKNNKHAEKLTARSESSALF